MASSTEITQRLAWVHEGTALFVERLHALTDEQLAEPSHLPNWTRGHVAAHVGLNAKGLGNLVHWARTGEVTPMYPSAEARNADIEEWAALPPAELRQLAREASQAFDASMVDVSDDAWAATVTNFQGVEIPASIIPWLRTRELMIHTVDMDAGVTMADLPTDFLVALVDDVAAQRSEKLRGPALTLRHSASERHWHIDGDGEPANISGSVADLASYLLGRPAPSLRTIDDDLPPELPRWL